MTKFLTSVFLILSFLLLSTAWLLLGTWLVGLVLIVLLPIVLILLKRKFPATLNLALTLLVGLAAIGLWRGLNFPLAFASVLCVLAAWDLNRFSQWLEFASAEDGVQRMELQHLLQLGLVLALGLGFSLVSLSIRFAPGFEWAVFLALASFAGIGALVNWLGNREA